jgi:subtilisin family serine protease
VKQLTGFPPAIPLVAIVLAVTIPGTALAAAFVPQPVYPGERDLDGDGIDDSLERVASATMLRGDGEEPLSVIVTLYSPPGEADVALFEQLGGVVKYRYETAVYGFAGTVPASQLQALAERLRPALCIIEPNLTGSAHLDDSARQIRVRSQVWSATPGYGYQGRPDIIIAICDSGIDATHPDLSGKVNVWQDFTSEAEATTVDRNGHGSCVASVVAGTGVAIGSGAIGSLTTTMSGSLPTTDTFGYVDMIKVPIPGSA